jgi:prepilin peptidase CpaA
VFAPAAFVPDLVLLAFIGLLGWAAYSDVLSFRIPNRVVLAIVFLYPAHVVASYPEVNWIGGVATGGVLLGICFLLYVMRWTGAGDAKLIAGVGLWAGPDQVVLFVLATAIVGALISLLVMIRRYFGSLAVERGSLLMRVLPVLSEHIPYGVAISAGGLVVAVRLFSH